MVTEKLWEPNPLDGIGKNHSAHIDNEAHIDSEMFSSIIK